MCSRGLECAGLVALRQCLIRRGNQKLESKIQKTSDVSSNLPIFVRGISTTKFFLICCSLPQIVSKSLILYVLKAHPLLILANLEPKSGSWLRKSDLSKEILYRVCTREIVKIRRAR